MKSNHGINIAAETIAPWSGCDGLGRGLVWSQSTTGHVELSQSIILFTHKSSRINAFSLQYSIYICNLLLHLHVQFSQICYFEKYSNHVVYIVEV